jgi:hypothetical protein
MSALRDRLAGLFARHERKRPVRVDDGESRIEKRKQELEEQEKAINRRRALKYGVGGLAVAGGGWLVYDRVTQEGPDQVTQSYYKAVAEGDSDARSEHTHSEAPGQGMPEFVQSRYEGSEVSVESTETADQGDSSATVEVTLDVGGSTRRGTVECRTEGGQWRLWAGEEQPLLPAPQAVVFRYYDELNRGNGDAAQATLHEDSPVSELQDPVVTAYERNDIRIVRTETVDRSDGQATVETVIVGASESAGEQFVTIETRTEGDAWKVWLE